MALGPLPVTLLLTFLVVSCRSAARPSGEGSGDPRRAIGAVLDDWHRAASEADGARYFGHMTSDAVFVGTDATERWDLSAFRAFAEPYFTRGQGWTYTSIERHIALSDDGRTAWFDERLENAKLGECRGSGVLVRRGGTWRIAQYVLSIPIPNALAEEVTARIRGRE